MVLLFPRCSLGAAITFISTIATKTKTYIKIAIYVMILIVTKSACWSGLS